MISTVLVTIVGIILIFVYAGHWVRIIILNRGEARIFQRGGGGHSRDTIRGSPTIYGLYRCSPSGTPPTPPLATPMLNLMILESFPHYGNVLN